jgi:alpha-1,3-mannosyltransferase
MPPPRRKVVRQGKGSVLESLVQELTLSNLRKLAVSPAHSWVAAVLLLGAELLLNTVVIHRVKYTEIDWVAYMQVPLSSI